MQALYRQYRPKKFADVVGQENIIKTLQNQIRRSSMAHAYVFVGTRGVGKTSVARLFAAAVNCLNPQDGEVCAQCDHCKLIEQGQFPDIIEIDAASHTGVDNVRTAIVEAVRFAPMQGAKKVFIIDEVHMLSTSAFNALLKTLEEPPAHALFILATTEFRKIPETVASRCQRFFFQDISEPLIEKTLKSIVEQEGRVMTDEAIHAVARIASGSLRDAERTLEQIFSTTDGALAIEHVQQVVPVPSTDIVFSLFIDALRGNAEGIEKELRSADEQGISMRLLLEELIELNRAALLCVQGAKNIHSIWMHHAKWEELQKVASRDVLLGLMKALIDPTTRYLDIGVSYLGVQLALLSIMGTSMQTVQGTPVQMPAQSLTESMSPPTLSTRPTLVAPSAGEALATPELSTVPPASTETPVDAHHVYTVEELQNKWGRCCDAVGKQSVSLPLVLRAARPTAYDGTVMELTFDRQFHFETMSDMRNLNLLTNCVRDVLQKEITIKPIFVPKQEEKELEDMAHAFGGAVLDEALGA